MKLQRFIDNKHNMEVLRLCKNFRTREHEIPPVRILVYITLIPIVIIFSLVYLGFNTVTAYLDQQIEMTETTMMVLVLISILCTALAVLFAVIINKVRRILLATEFQNFLFSDMTSIDKDFCLLVSYEIKQMHYNAEAAKLFPCKGDKSPDHIQALLNHDGLKRNDAKRLQEAIQSGKTAEAPLTINGTTYTIEVTPLPRTKGKVSMVSSQSTSN